MFASKKFILFSALFTCFCFHTSFGIVIKKVPLQEHILAMRKQEMFNGGLALLLFGLALEIKGVLDVYDIPVSFFDRFKIASRKFLSKEDLEKHHLGNNIVIATELVAGCLAILFGYVIAHSSSTLDTIETIEY